MSDLQQPPVVHPIFRNKPPLEAKLWRYLSFAKFASLLDAGYLHFTRVDKFDDHFEGAWPQQDLQFWQGMQGFDVPKFTEDNRMTTVASCWIESEHESAGMWRLYAQGQEAVAIVTSFRKLEQLVGATFVDNGEGRKALAGAARVRYVDHFKEGLLDQRPDNVLWPFMSKNVSYDHEHEVRALIHLHQVISSEGLDLPLKPIDFIDEIVTGPFGQPWFDKTVRGVAERYGLADRIRSSSLSPANFYIKRV